MGMPFGYPRIIAHYGGGAAQGLDKIEPTRNIDLEKKKGNSNVYSTRILVNPRLVAYIKPDRDTRRDNST
jgi:hypothetical protein